MGTVLVIFSLLCFLYTAAQFEIHLPRSCFCPRALAENERDFRVGSQSPGVPSQKYTFIPELFLVRLSILFLLTWLAGFYGCDCLNCISSLCCELHWSIDYTVFLLIMIHFMIIYFMIVSQSVVCTRNCFYIQFKVDVRSQEKQVVNKCWWKLDWFSFSYLICFNMLLLLSNVDSWHSENCSLDSNTDVLFAVVDV